MTSRIHSVVTCGTLALAAWFSPFAGAQDATPPAGGSVQDELRSLRQMIEQQSKQIDALTAQITRLGGELERRNMASGGTALPDTGTRETSETAPAAGSAAPAAPTPKVVAPPANVHIVVKGDSLDKIAKTHQTTIAELLKINKITDPKKLQIGQQITLPPNTTATPPANPEKKEGQ